MLISHSHSYYFPNMIHSLQYESSSIGSTSLRCFSESKRVCVVVILKPEVRSHWNVTEVEMSIEAGYSSEVRAHSNEVYTSSEVLQLNRISVNYSQFFNRGRSLVRLRFLSFKAFCRSVLALTIRNQLTKNLQQQTDQQQTKQDEAHFDFDRCHLLRCFCNPNRSSSSEQC